ncbi:MAG: hypothetical protein WB996_01315, partial [Ignavibacteriaceae bacterium]
MIFFAISQTSTFRNYLKDYVTEKVNSSINGKLNIENLDGTIFTTLILHNTTLTFKSDTLLKASKIELKTSPLELLFKRIYVRYAGISDANVNLIKGLDGRLNLSVLGKPSTEDSTSSKFPFKIVAPDFELHNVNFNLQNYNYVNSTEVYDSLNFDDLRVKNINLKLAAVIDLGKKDFFVEINKLSFAPNLKYFDLKNLSGKIAVNPGLISAEKLLVKTSESDISINGTLHNYDLFGSSEFKNGELDANIDGDVSLKELSNFVSVFKNSVEQVKFKTRISGRVHNLSASNVDVSFLKTNIETRGRIYNLNDPGNLELKLSFFNSYINEPDVNKLFPTLNIPVFQSLGLLTIDTLRFDGKPLDFNAKILLRTQTGSILVDGHANLQKELIDYNLNFSTSNFDLMPFAGFTSRINSTGKLKGYGTDPKSMKANLKFNGNGSTISGINLDSLNITVNADKKNVLYSLDV